MTEVVGSKLSRHNTTWRVTGPCVFGAGQRGRVALGVATSYPRRSWGGAAVFISAELRFSSYLAGSLSTRRMDFTAHNLHIATVTDAVQEGDVLLLTLDLGGTQHRTDAHITENYTPEALVGRQVVVVTNGPEGATIVLAAVSTVQGAVLLKPEWPVENGARVV